MQDSLLHVAMQNFSADEARAEYFPAGSLLQSGSAARGVMGITPLEFAQGCRALDLGRLYQRHISDVLNLSDEQTRDKPYVNAVATDIGRMKVLDMKIDAHIAVMRADISADTYRMLCTLLDRQLTPSQAQAAGVLFQGRPVTWQGLNTEGGCLWSILVFSGRSIAQYPQEPCVVYMPNEPERPLFEYSSLDDLQAYLKRKLGVAAYRAFFARYLSQGDRVGFFSRLDQASMFGALEANLLTVSLPRYFFDTYAAKLQADARALAVPVADVDEEARERRLQAYLDAGLTVLNLAGLVVPELGVLMTGVAIGQMLGELYEGIEDWRRGDKEEAFKQMVAVAENITSMVLFAAGSKVVGSAMKRSGLNLDSFFATLTWYAPRRATCGCGARISRRTSMLRALSMMRSPTLRGSTRWTVIHTLRSMSVCTGLCSTRNWSNGGPVTSRGTRLIARHCCITGRAVGVLRSNSLTSGRIRSISFRG